MHKLYFFCPKLLIKRFSGVTVVSFKNAKILEGLKLVKEEQKYVTGNETDTLAKGEVRRDANSTYFVPLKIKVKGKIVSRSKVEATEVSRAPEQID